MGPLVTSLLFLTNIVHAFYVQAAGLHHAWLVVLATSLLYHGYHGAPDSRMKSLLRRIDQGAVAVVITVGAVYWWYVPTAFKVGSFALFGSCILFYAYGFYQRCFCFAEPPHDRTWHSVLHISASAGHHLLLGGLW